MKHYTFNMTCSFNMQYTFTDREVEPDTDGIKGDFEPTDEALFQLEAEIRKYLEQNYSAVNIQVSTVSDALLGVVDDTPPSA